MQTLVANVDLAFVVTSLGPEFDAAPDRALPRHDLGERREPGDRADEGRPPRGSAPRYVAEVEAVAPGVPVHVVSAKTGRGLRRAARAHRTRASPSVLLGSSGVGKSTLVNRFAGSELMSTGETRADDDEGRHTTSHRELILLPGGGIVIDTPGLRELQLAESAGGLRRGVRRRRGARGRRAASTTARTRASPAAPFSPPSRRARSRPSGSRAGASSSASCTRSRSAATPCSARRRRAGGSSSAATPGRARGPAELRRDARGGGDRPPRAEPPGPR